MASASSSILETASLPASLVAQKPMLLESINRLSQWLEANHYEGYDTFDGLNARYVRWLTFENPLLRIVLQQGVRRFPINLRPVLGVRKSRSTKGMGFLSIGFIRLHKLTGEQSWAEKADWALQWLVENVSSGYAGACWGNHFDYQSRSVFEKKLSPSVVWTSHIGHAFIDAYEHLGNEKYLEVAVSSCEHILKDLGSLADGEARCINYFPTSTHQVHNANTLGGSLLARTYRHTHNEAYRDLAERSMLYTAKYQHEDGAWDYGELPNLRWVDNFHTAYVLDCLKRYEESTGDAQFHANMMRGYEYWKGTFFLADGTPRYYNNRTRPLDIQCSSQAIDTLSFFADLDPRSVPLAIKVAEWTIRNMQDRSGYFYYRRYPGGLVNKTPTLHWGQATMFSALAGLLTAF
jgi:polysaccharide biosynthesis protein VpsJ